MTSLGWLALAVALGLVSLPSAASARIGALAGRGRVGLPPGQRHAGRLRAVSWPAALAIVGVGAALAIGVRFGPLLALATAALVATAAVLVRDTLRGREEAAGRADLTSAVRVLVAELEAGSQPAAALAAAGGAGARVAPPLLDAAAAARRGEDAGLVLATSGVAGLAAVGAAWRLGESTGAALADVLARVDADLSADAEQRRTVTTTLAGPRSSAALLSGLPVLGVALGTGMGARPLPYLISAPSGHALCCAGVLLDVAGILWMRRIVRRAETT